MWWWHGGWGWGAWLAMSLAMVVFWGLLLWGIITIARSASGDPPPGGDPERILAERFARGEIDEDEYRRRLDTLRSPARRAKVPAGGQR